MRRFPSLVLALVVAFAATPASASVVQSAVSPAAAQARLQEGNARFAAGEMEFPRFGKERRQEVTEYGQHPFATVITCSDSRVPAEVLFDQGIGDVFVIRVAGNVCDTDEIGSIEYGVDHLGTPVLVVLGHTHCGAVTAVATGAEVHGSIPPLVDNIEPAVARTREAHPDLSDQELVPHAIETNVWVAIEDLLTNSHAVRERAARGDVKIVGGVYDIGTGDVEWMGEHPEQEKVIEQAAHHGHDH